MKLFDWEHIDKSYFLKIIIKIITGIRYEERESIVKQALSLDKSMKNGFILRSLIGVNSSEREDFIRQVILLCEGLNNKDFPWLAIRLAEIPSEQREEIVAFTKALISIDMSHEGLTCVLKAVSSVTLPETKEAFVKQMQSLVKETIVGDNRGILIHSLVSVASDQRQSIVESVDPFFNRYDLSYHGENITQTFIDLEPEERRTFSNQVQSLIPDIDRWYNILNIVEIIKSLAPEYRELAVDCIKQIIRNMHHDIYDEVTSYFKKVPFTEWIDLTEQVKSLYAEGVSLHFRSLIIENLLKIDIAQRKRIVDFISILAPIKLDGLGRYHIIKNLVELNPEQREIIVPQAKSLMTVSLTGTELASIIRSLAVRELFVQSSKVPKTSIICHRENNWIEFVTKGVELSQWSYLIKEIKIFLCEGNEITPEKGLDHVILRELSVFDPQERLAVIRMVHKLVTVNMESFEKAHLFHIIRTIPAILRKEVIERTKKKIAQALANESLTFLMQHKPCCRLSILELATDELFKEINVDFPITHWHELFQLNKSANRIYRDLEKVQ